LYAEWESKGFFKPDTNAPQGPFSIVIPPPNVTGILHMGHALNNTLQDILTRWKRMQRYSTLWVPGTDHAGIATQNVVERQLGLEKITRQQLGREKFVEKVWEWKRQYGSTIVGQLRRLGSSCDWSRERFTMDEGLSKAVQSCFLQLHQAGLVYRGYYLVNGCPRCQTALSDEEVMHEEVKGHLWHIKYEVKGEGSRVKGDHPPYTLHPTPDFIVVATTRPETLLGDVAVAVHPDDDRYKGLKGDLILPLLKRPLKIIRDGMVDREFGTGAVKVTPAHDLNDFQLAQRHGLQAIRVIGPDGKMTEQAGPYAGLDRFECRKKIVADLEEQGLLVKTENYKTSVGHCYRCKTVIEPALTPQWFVKMKPLAQLGLEAVQKDGMRFIPERWTKVYLDWLNNIRDWCISRQIWWGHRIPAWYCKKCYPAYVGERQKQTLSSGTQFDEKEAGILVSPQKPAACSRCGGSDLVQDEDVLDTWFSSWLWPFSTLGWPDKTPDLATFYPTSVLVTGQDIIFFWVARMVMAGKFFMKKIPFKEVYIHGIIRVEGGKKMSKSLGNIIDPLEIIERMGADGLRFSIAHMASEGQDIYLSENKFLVGRNFANKLWNASRLILEGGEQQSTGYKVPDTPVLTLADRWILSRLQRAIADVTASLEVYRFNEVARGLYQFVWHDFCDWYLEIAKLQREQKVQSTEPILRYLLTQTLKLLHPVMPFITEEIWKKIQKAEGSRQKAAETIMKALWPEPDPSRVDQKAEESFGRLQSVITEVRNIRSTFRIPPKDKVNLTVRGEKGLEILSQHEVAIQRLAGVRGMTLTARPALEEAPPRAAAQKAERPVGAVVSHLPAGAGCDAWDLIVPLAGLVDLTVERQRIQKEMESIQTRAQSKKSRLNDPTFRDKAPADIVAEEEESLKELEGELAKWAESLKQLQ
jgi:valyl-tRNA synthetase